MSAPRVDAAANVLCKHWLRSRASRADDTATILANLNLTEDDMREAEDLADDWYQDELRDRPDRVAHMESLQTEPMDPHGPWGAP